MRILVGLVIAAILLGVGYYWFTSKVDRETSTPIGLAIGPAAEGQCPIHIVVSMGMARAEEPRLEHGVMNWEKWIAEHFELKSAAGEVVPLRRLHHSNLISDQQAMTPDSFLVGQVKPGQQYTLTYRPRTYEPARFRHAFTVSANGEPFARYMFQPVP